MKRRDFIKLSGAAGATLATLPLGCASEKAASRPPNILVLLTDDHGRWAQHAYGNSELRTPNLDRLAAMGTRMTHAFTTCPVCSPARASFFTGRMPSQHGIHDWLMEPWSNDPTRASHPPDLKGQTLISELLRNAGYHTGLVGKWHCGPTHEPQPGFDRWFCYWDSQYPHLGTQNFSDQGKHVTEEGLQSPFLTQRAVEFLQHHRATPETASKPFFLYVSYVDTHVPHKDAPPELVAQYENATFKDIPQETFATCHGTALHKVEEKAASERRRRMQYYGAVSSLDREVGKVLAELDASGQMENTLIVYTSDHGLNGGHHGVWEKGNATLPQNFLEESVRIACTVAWPNGGVRANAFCGDLVNHCDLWATLLEAAGAKPNAEVARQINSPGRSYLGQLRGHTSHDWRQTMFSEYGNARMACNARYKYIQRRPYAGVGFPDELYDLQNDPRETQNVIADSTHATALKELTVELEAFFDKYTIPGHSGYDLEHQPDCTPASPWAVAAKKQV